MLCLVTCKAKDFRYVIIKAYRLTVMHSTVQRIVDVINQVDPTVTLSFQKEFVVISCTVRVTVYLV